MTIIIHFRQSRYRDFKTYYTRYVLVPLCAYLVRCYGRCSSLSFIDSTPLAVCHSRRIPQQRTFAGIAQRGRNSVD